MLHLEIVVEDEGEFCWPDLMEKQLVAVDSLCSPLRLSGLAGGMASGAPSVTLRIDLPDGRVVLAQTSLAMLLTAMDALTAKYGDPRLGRRRRDGDKGDGSPISPISPPMRF